jgi:hypothetical protein
VGDMTTSGACTCSDIGGEPLCPIHDDVALDENEAVRDVETAARRYGSSASDEDRWALNAAIARLDKVRNV